MAGPTNIHFGDAGCTEPALWVSDCAEAPTIALHSEHCSLVSTWYALGEPLAKVYHGDPDFTCDPSGGRGRGFTVGPTVDRATFPAVERVSVGTGALRVEGSGIGGTWRNGGGAFVDTERGVWCDPYETDSGVRCLSFVADARPESVHADDSCTTPIIRVDASSCYGTRVTFGFRPDGSGCKQTVVAAYELGESRSAFSPFGALRARRRRRPPSRAPEGSPERARGMGC